MTYRYCFEAVDRSLRDVRYEPNKVFGGLPFIFGGDFAQTLPVVKGGNESDVLAASLRCSRLWLYFKVLYLT